MTRVMREAEGGGGGGGGERKELQMEVVSQVNNSAHHRQLGGVSTWVSHGKRQQMKRGTTISSEE